MSTQHDGIRADTRDPQDTESGVEKGSDACELGKKRNGQTEQKKVLNGNGDGKHADAASGATRGAKDAKFTDSNRISGERDRCDIERCRLVAKTFLTAVTKKSDSSEDLLPQVHACIFTCEKKRAIIFPFTCHTSCPRRKSTNA